METIAGELSLRPEQVERTLALHEGGATVPFIARYRKEATGNLDEVQIQAILDRFSELKELDERRAAILRSIEEQGKLTPALSSALNNAKTRTELEDLYLPFRPKRRTRATMARERGFEPLADVIWGVAGAKWTAPLTEEALAGARDICAERVSEDAALRRFARGVAARRGVISSTAKPLTRPADTLSPPGGERAGVRGKFELYYDWSEPLASVPSHRALAVFRGEAEEVLKVTLRLPDEEIVAGLKQRLARRTPMPDQLALAIEDGWKRLMSVSLEGELRAELKDRADAQAIEVFGQNLRNLLLTPPAGSKRVLALDPGLRTGIKTAMLDATGRLLETATLYTERSGAERANAEKQLQRLVAQHKPDLIAVGNGTGSREAEAFVRAAVTNIPLVSVSEQGASIYSASEVAREEFPDLDVSLRGAVSIGRRLQDPLGELVKIEAKSIGVGQYQHDVNQPLLRKKLGETVDWCVNLVGVDANTASPQLLEHVSGIGPVLAKRIVEHRNSGGPFPARRTLLEVRGLGARAFEQCAGFMRIRNAHPLDDSAVHPERYALVERMASDLGVPLRELIGNAALVERIDWHRYVADDVGEPTLRDILAELKKPGRDPRGSFEPPKFRDDVQTLADLRERMQLEGVVTNVTQFGAFVDVGVHRDGLVHVSQLPQKVKVGDRVAVRVVSVELERKRFALTMKGVSS